MKLEGVAYLPEPGEMSETWEVPDHPIPLRVEFDPNRLVGMATLTKQEDGTITAVADVSESVAERLKVSLPPFFAVGVAFKGDTRENGRVYGLSVCSGNVNPLVPPYEKVEE